MGRPATGQVLLDTRGESPRFAMRFRAYGKRHYLSLGSEADGWTHAKAALELQNILADVRRGSWSAPHPEPAAPVESDPRFHDFASQWFEASKGEWRAKTVLDYQWQLSHHLLPFFKDHRLSEITVAEVDRYRQRKVAEARAIQAAAAEGKPLKERYTDRHGHERTRTRRPLSATSINKTITRLTQILEVAVEYALIESNPARGRRRRLKAGKPAQVWLDRAEQIEALLNAAGELDKRAALTGGHDHKGAPAYRRALLATLVLAGLRIGEATALRWRDVDLAASRISIRSSKTDAGIRHVELLPALHDELADHKARASDASPDQLVFLTTAGTELKHSNIRSRVLEKAIAQANEMLTAEGQVPLPEGLTPHKLRHTFASILVALGVDPGSVMDQLGHTDAGFTLRVYRHGMRRGPGANNRLRIFVGRDQEATSVDLMARTPTWAVPAGAGEQHGLGAVRGGRWRHTSSAVRPQD
jgi:integrase